MPDTVPRPDQTSRPEATSRPEEVPVTPLAEQRVTDTGIDAESGTRIVVGGYTPELDGHAIGLSGHRWNASNDSQVEVVAFEPLALTSPSWVVAHPQRPTVYAVSESTPGHVHVVDITDSGDLELRASVASGGEGGCHAAISPDTRHLVVAHYGSGTVTTLAIDPTGGLSEVIDTAPVPGGGPDHDRQREGHAHQVVFDGATLLVASLGDDRVHRFDLDAEGHLTDLAQPVVLPAGSGPRHLVITGEHMVVACELSAQVWLGRRGPQGWAEVEVVASTTHEDHSGDTKVYPSGIAVVADQVLIANRGSDTVAVFDLDRATDALTPAQEFPTAGAWPRDLTMVDGRLWVANQVGDQVSVFVADRTSPGGGRWQLDFQFPSPSPACVVLIDRAASPNRKDHP